MKKLFLVFIFFLLNPLFSLEYKFFTDLEVNKILRASINQNYFIFIYGENEDFMMFIGENDGCDFLFTDKQSVSALKKFVDVINKKADEGKLVTKISIGNARWVFEYDDCFFVLVKEDHFVFKEMSSS